MKRDPHAIGYWKTVRLLLGAARQRSKGRQKRQQELLRNRSGGRAGNWSGLGFGLSVFFMLLLNVLAAIATSTAVEAGQRIAAEHQGKIVVDRWFYDAVDSRTDSADSSNSQADDTPPGAPDAEQYADEARSIAERYGGSRPAIEARLRNEVNRHGAKNLISRREAEPGLRALETTGPVPAMLGSIFLFWWAVMLVFQGEGLELDLQRRRHPMWEWLFSHPAPAGAIFQAEMLSPIAANPIYWGGPLFAGVLLGVVYGPLLGLLAALLMGVPATVAAACLGKAFEIGVTLRFSPRSRGAMIGLMSWLGYASMMLFFVGLLVIPKAVTAAARLLFLFAWLPWPWMKLFLGARADGSFSFLSALLAWWIASAITVACAVRFSVWGAQQGLSGNFASTAPGPSAARGGAAKSLRGRAFGKEPLYRKEFLWFARDRSAIVQTILIPLTVAGIQVFNLRGVLSQARGAWNYLCGAAICFGTYFLWILGPKSLTSEGSALWIALTWPRGLESLLKAKAWLWSLLSTGLVALVLGYACFVFPADIWKIALVGVAWFFFARSMAEKSVTLVTVASSSGEAEKIPWGRRWAAQLGMLTFAIGVLTGRWQIAFMGIVYSYVTAAAMWENFRARLPFLYDPWSERVPPPPTLMHAMVAISILVEGGAVLTGLALVIVGRENIAIAQALSYGVCAVAVSIGVTTFLSKRGVAPAAVWIWRSKNVSISGESSSGESNSEASSLTQRLGLSKFGLSGPALVPKLLAGACGGLALGLLAHAYLALLGHIPVVAEMLRKSQQQMASIRNLRVSYAVMAVGFAPFAEEYLFRGLLYRALDREWGGWRAVLGSAAFFAIYHPPLAWVPVMLLGATNALLFKKTGRLVPAVILHMVYNAVVLS
jgi:membrane protease YdiL (CAAX protease family)